MATRLNICTSGFLSLLKFATLFIFVLRFRLESVVALSAVFRAFPRNSENENKTDWLTPPSIGGSRLFDIACTQALAVFVIVAPSKIVRQTLIRSVSRVRVHMVVYDKDGNESIIDTVQKGNDSGGSDFFPFN